MNEIVNRFLFAGDEFMPEMHLRQPGFIYSACGPFTKNKERIKQNKETGDLRYIYQNEEQEHLLIKYYVVKHLILLKILNMMNINVDLLQWFINFLIKNLQVAVSKMKIFLIKN